MTRAGTLITSTAWLVLGLAIIATAVVLVGLFAYYLIGNLWGPLGVVIAAAVIVALVLRHERGEA